MRALRWLRGAPRRLHNWTAASPPLTRRQFFGAFALLFALVTLALIGESRLARANHDLARANEERIADNRQRLSDIRNAQKAIQASRLESCKATYHSFPRMFRPFFPEHRRKWSAKQRSDWRKLRERADELSRIRCPKQVGPIQGGQP